MASLLYQWLLIAFFKMLSPATHDLAGDCLPHPFHVSVTEINHNAKDKTLEVSCKIFIDDFSDALAKKYKTKVDLIDPASKSAMDKIVSDYVLNHLQIKPDDKNAVLNYVGFEAENEAIYVYMQVNDVPTLKKVTITATILYDQFTDQTQIVHVIENGNRKSTKIDYPASQVVFQF